MFFTPLNYIPTFLDYLPVDPVGDGEVVHDRIVVEEVFIGEQLIGVE